MNPVKQMLTETQSSFETLQKEGAKLVNKWQKSGLLEGLNNAYEKNYMSIMLENQSKQLITEWNQTNTGGQPVSGGAGMQWAGIALPLVRKIFGEIAAKEFVSVQSMNVPSGLVFYLDFTYDNRQPKSGGRFEVGESVYGITNTPNVDANGGLYGSGNFGYSFNEYSQTVTGSSTTCTNATQTTVNNDARFYPLTGSLKELAVPLTGDLAGAQLDAVKGFTVYPVASLTGTASFDQYFYPEFTKVSGSFNVTTNVFTPTHIVFVLNSSVQAQFCGQDLKVEFFKSNKSDCSTPYNVGDFEDRKDRRIKEDASVTGSSAIPEINIEMKSESITARTRKLKARWTPEFSQDLNAYHNIDAEAELTSMIAQYVGLEIDQEILDMLMVNANTTDFWSVQNNKFLTSSGSTTSGPVQPYLNSQGGWFSTLGTKIQKVSNTIHQKTLRGGANFLVMSPQVSTVVESIAGFAADTDGNKDEFNMGCVKIGSLSNRWKVYKNPYMTSNTILMGYKGNQFLETGAVYAPYIPLLQTPVVFDQETFTPSKGLMTRYATKMIRPEFYGKIYVDDLNLL